MSFNEIKLVPVHRMIIVVSSPDGTTKSQIGNNETNLMLKGEDIINFTQKLVDWMKSQGIELTREFLIDA